MPALCCPHCGKQSLIPNTWAAKQPANVARLEERFRAAVRLARIRGCKRIFRDLKAKLARSRAVISRRIHDVERLSYSDRECYASYYQLLNAQLRLPDGDEWDSFRRSADEALFPGYREHIRFAAITLDDVGVHNYGDWSLVLRTNMIQHRTSTFEENSLVFARENRITIAEAELAMIGHRASWNDRAKLGMAKLVDFVTPRMEEIEFPSLVIRQGRTSGEDRFVEAHIFGPLTIHSVEKVVLTKHRDTRRLASKSRLLAIRKSLQAVNVEFVIRA